ncbi:hypothetical protein [Streptomyces sp. NPDC058228]|uniref:hypothetical protein n=1 Tax=Streptomyces sp. NPDC058228 TaxID=3346390 RepID=UPI0036EDEC44
MISKPLRARLASWLRCFDFQSTLERPPQSSWWPWCQDDRHWSTLRTGVAPVPAPALLPVVTLLTARAAQRFGCGPLVAAGGLLFTGGMVWLACFASVTPDYLRDLLPSQVMTGAGVGLTLGTLVAAGVHALPGHRAATGSALVNSVRAGRRAPRRSSPRRMRGL